MPSKSTNIRQALDAIARLLLAFWRKLLHTNACLRTNYTESALGWNNIRDEKLRYLYLTKQLNNKTHKSTRTSLSEGHDGSTTVYLNSCFYVTASGATGSMLETSP